MKKLSLSVKTFKKRKILTRSQLKKVLGGYGSSAPNCKMETDCKLFINGQNEEGDCSEYGFIGSDGYPHVECFCKTLNHQTPTKLSSNGGISRCNP